MVVTAIALGVASGCANATPRDVVVMKIDARRAHVGLGSGEVTVGNAVIVRRHFCSPDPTKGKNAETCGDRVVAHGKVIEVYDARYSAIEISDGDLEEGDTVEKAP